MRYNVHYRAVANVSASSLVTNVSVVDTDFLTMKLTGLTPGTRYRVRTRWVMI